MLKKALRVVWSDPETLLFTAGAMLLLLAPLALVIVVGIEAADPDAAGGLTAAFAPATQFLWFLWGHGIGRLFALPAIMFAAVGSFCLGGLLTCAILACALKRLSGEEPTFTDGLSAMWRMIPRIIPFALGSAFGGRSGDPLVAPASSYALVVMVAEDVGFGEALDRARDMNRRGVISFAKLWQNDESLGGWLGAVAVAGWLLGMWIGLSGDGQHETTVGVMGPMFGLPIALMIVFGCLIATLQIVALADSYVSARRRGARPATPRAG